MTIRPSAIRLGMILLLTGCAAHSRNATTQPAADADEAVARVRAILPAGWQVVRVDRDTFPFYRSSGKGVGVYIAPPTLHQRKAEYEGAVFIMPASYNDPGGDPTHGKAQT